MIPDIAKRVKKVRKVSRTLDHVLKAIKLLDSEQSDVFNRDSLFAVRRDLAGSRDMLQAWLAERTVEKK